MLCCGILRSDGNKSWLVLNTQFWLAVTAGTSPPHFSNLWNTTKLIDIDNMLKNNVCVVISNSTDEYMLPNKRLAILDTEIYIYVVKWTITSLISLGCLLCCFIS